MGFQELLLIGAIALLVIGPERFPSAIRTTTLWITRLRRSFNQIKEEIEREIDADHIKREFHNQSIMKTLEKSKADLSDTIQDTAASLKPELDNLEYDINDIVSPNTKANDTASEEPASSTKAPDSKSATKS